MQDYWPFDVVVLTAAGEAQADGYRAQLAWRERLGLLPAGALWHVMADPGGQRVGSGAATLQVLGQEPGHAALIARTSLLEQRMTSGGGWQDQVGGITPGVKLIRTQPGLEQIPRLQWSVFGGAGQTSQVLQNRLLLYFTGQERLAKNILQNVVGRYLAREEEAANHIRRVLLAHPPNPHARFFDLDIDFQGLSITVL